MVCLWLVMIMFLYDIKFVKDLVIIISLLVNSD